MKILTAAEMGAADRRTAEGGLSLAELMLAAGEAVAEFCLRSYPQAARVLVLCGKGNNGGDGLVAARVLAGEGVGVRVLLLGQQADLKGEALQALRALKDSTSDDIVEEFAQDSDAAASDELDELFSEADLVVDAVFGTGFKPPLRGAAVQLREALQRVPVPVVAVDLPSGWDADSMAETADGAFRADAVVTFTAPKLAHVFGQLTSGAFGQVVVVPIGSPAEAVESATGLRWAGAATTLTETPRSLNSNKGRFGHVLVVGGSYGTAGAPAMASLACLRAGAGLVTAAVPRAVMDRVGAIAPELMVRGLQEPAVPVGERTFGTASTANLEPAQLDELLKGIKVIALGPGLSTHGEASAFARGLVAATRLPLVLDADGLNAFDAGRVGELDGRERVLVLTPHPGEMARLVGLTVAEVEADRIGIARRFATEHHLTLVLKGWRTLIAHPDGKIAVNTSGNPGLAKGGSGDILTGIVAAMLAQYPGQVAEAVEAAVYLHGRAADLAVGRGGIHEKALLATDVIAHLSAAFHDRSTDAAGWTWLGGLGRLGGVAAQPAETIA